MTSSAFVAILHWDVVYPSSFLPGPMRGLFLAHVRQPKCNDLQSLFARVAKSNYPSLWPPE